MRPRGDDAGAAVIEFVMIAVLLVFLLFGVLQVAVYFYARNVAASSAADAARYAAAEGVDPRAGVERAETLIRQGLDDADARAISCTSRQGRDAASGLATVTVRCEGRLRLLFTPLGIPLRVAVQSTVLKEQA
ncbi:TadE/TadG family type IV pilus assembly protein [Jatrophihabitans fulvus]